MWIHVCERKIKLSELLGYNVCERGTKLRHSFAYYVCVKLSCHKDIMCM